MNKYNASYGSYSADDIKVNSCMKVLAIQLAK